MRVIVNPTRLIANDVGTSPVKLLIGLLLAFYIGYVIGVATILESLLKTFMALTTQMDSI